MELGIYHVCGVQPWAGAVALLSTVGVKGGKRPSPTFILCSLRQHPCVQPWGFQERVTPSLGSLVIGAVSLVSPTKFNRFHLINHRNGTQN